MEAVQSRLFKGWLFKRGCSREATQGMAVQGRIFKGWLCLLFVRRRNHGSSVIGAHVRNNFVILSVKDI